MPKGAATAAHSTSRRGLLAAVASLSGGLALGLSPVPAASDAGGPDAELIDLCELFHEQHRDLARMYRDDDDDEQALALNEDRWNTAYWIERMRPATMGGARAKGAVAAILLAECQGEESSDLDIRLALTALRELADAPPPSA